MFLFDYVAAQAKTRKGKSRKSNPLLDANNFMNIEHKIPFVVIRTISDTAGYKSSADYQSFIKDVASVYSLQIIKNIYAQGRK